MTPPILTFFNNKFRVEKTSLIYHLAWMYAILEKRVAIVDIDPQANLTAAFLDEEKIDKLWNNKAPGSTVFECIAPLADDSGIADPILQRIAPELYLLPGDARLAGHEETLASAWQNSLGDGNLYRPMRLLSTFWQVMQKAGAQAQADIILVDVGPNLGAINRSVLIATDYVLIPLGSDLFSLQALKNLGPTLRRWQNAWQKRLDNWRTSPESKKHADFLLPQGRMHPIGYVCQQPGLKLERPITVLDKWLNQVPEVYREAVLEQPAGTSIRQQDDPYCLATIKHYRCLHEMAQEHRKPIFKLTPADGALGSHAAAAQDARKDFKALALKIAEKMGS